MLSVKTRFYTKSFDRVDIQITHLNRVNLPNGRQEIMSRTLEFVFRVLLL